MKKHSSRFICSSIFKSKRNTAIVDLPHFFIQLHMFLDYAHLNLDLMLLLKIKSDFRDINRSLCVG